MSDRNLKTVCFTSYHKNDIYKLRTFETTGKDFEYLQLTLNDCTHLRDILKTFPNIKKLEIRINDYNEDMKSNVVLPHLRSVHLGKLVPMEFKNIWNIFSNLEDVTIGSRDNYELFTSEFVNRVIGRNEKTLKKLELLDIPVLRASFRPLRVPCQLDELEIIVCDQRSKEKICRIQRDREKQYEKQKYMKKPGKVFFTKEEDITTFDNFKDILRSQKLLKTFKLDEAEIDSEMMDIVANMKCLTYFKVMSPDFKFNEISSKAKEFLQNIKRIYISHISECSSIGFQIILENLKNVEVLDIHCVWPEVDFKPLESRILLPKLKQLQMHINHKTEEILDSFQFTETLTKISGDITHTDKVEELLKTSPNIKHFVLHFGSENVANFVVSRFKNLEWFEVTLRKLCRETVILIMKNAENLKRARILLYEEHSREDTQYVEEKLKTELPGFFFDYLGCTMEIHNTELDFKMKVGYHHFMQGRDWDDL